jgi:Flp pilus assembly pilin Flp
MFFTNYFNLFKSHKCNRCQSIEKGQGLIEYALIVLLVVVGVIVILGLVGGGVQNLYQEIINALP